MKYVTLPSEVTAFEKQYVERMNRIGLGFFWANLPLFVVVAFFNDTNPTLALALTLLTLAGPTLAWSMLSSVRAVSMVLGFTAMCMGGLLVHFGQGPLQIEMHFYFFSLLAVLAMFANPAVIYVAAVTVTLHHAVLWLVLPSSVFNYDASVWVVAVHAAFVVVESAAAIFIAQSFFDNVIGLDRIVQERTAELDQRNQDMRLVLDHVPEGLLTIDAAGQMGAERSAAFDAWFGVPETASWVEHLRKHDPGFASWFELAWEGLNDGFLPPEVAITQLPSHIKAEGRSYSIAYRPLTDDAGAIQRAMLVVSDITERLELEATEAAQREHLRVVECFVLDRQGVTEFFDEASELIWKLKSAESQKHPTLCRRFLHTFKGNAMAYGFDDLAELAHALEGLSIDEDRGLTPEELSELTRRFETLTATLAELRQEGDGQTIEIGEADLNRALTLLDAHPASEQVRQLMLAWSLESADQRLERIQRQATGIADRLGKSDVRVTVAGNGIRLDSARFRAFWQAFVHVLRNALDHGIEDPEERQALGKVDAPTVAIRTRVDEGELIIELFDDGRGIDWPAVARRAQDMGLPADTHAELIEALFSDGMSTAQEVTAFSGRGVGMGAVREATEALGGTVTVHSAQNVGSTIRFRFPQTDPTQAVWSDALAS